MSDYSKEIKEILTSLSAYSEDVLTTEEIIILWPELKEATAKLNALLVGARKDELESLQRIYGSISKNPSMGIMLDLKRRIAELTSLEPPITKERIKE